MSIKNAKNANASLMQIAFGSIIGAFYMPFWAAYAEMSIEQLHSYSPRKKDL